ncbi:hypothetical protein ACIRSU_23845 [Streptomyces sp. NPDC101160]|uniref:hypothetical protein n=1 Tax=Streptomyces sp. NPDC101160 TaxID=3366118 RepID=UPI0037FA0587
MATPEREDREDRGAHRAENVSMRDLLASCAAANAVSTPPREPRPGVDGEPRPVRDEAA